MRKPPPTPRPKLYRYSYFYSRYNVPGQVESNSLDELRQRATADFWSGLAYPIKIVVRETGEEFSQDEIVGELWMKCYHPANGSEAEIFMASFCDQCIRHPISSDARHQCEILLASFVCDGVQDPRHPTQWQYKDSQPCCTAFKSRQEEYDRRAANRKKAGSKLIPASQMPDLFEQEKNDNETTT